MFYFSLVGKVSSLAKLKASLFDDTRLNCISDRMKAPEGEGSNMKELVFLLEPVLLICIEVESNYKQRKVMQNCKKPKRAKTS